MKKQLIKVFMLLAYSIPYVFCTMREDVIYGTTWFYLIMIAAFGLLCYGCIRTKSMWVVFLGNVISLLSSYIFTILFKTEKWGWYFKPFTPYQFIIFETIFLFAIQIAVVMYFIKKANRKE